MVARDELSAAPQSGKTLVETGESPSGDAVRDADDMLDDDASGDRLAHLVLAVSRAFSKALQARLEQHGVPMGYWRYLRILWASDGLTQQELSVRAGLTPATTSMAIKGMQAAEYIVWTQLPSNRKNIYVYLTPKGRALKTMLEPLAKDVNHISADSLSASDLTTARHVLNTMLGNLVADASAALPALDAGLVKRPPSRTAARHRGGR